MPVVSVVAPPGFGKTTLLAQWAEQDPRPSVWLTVDEQDNDPARLVSYLVVALDRVTPVDPGVVGALAAPATSVVAADAPWLGATLAAAAHPLVVVLEDLHLLQDQQGWDVLEMLVDQLGHGSQLMLTGRSEPLLPIARLRAEARMVELGPVELAMDRDEVAALLAVVKVGLPDVDIAALAERTEGWPMAVYLAVLSLKVTSTGDGAGAALVGHDGLLVEYLHSVVLSACRPARCGSDGHGGAGPRRSCPAAVVTAPCQTAPTGCGVKDPVWSTASDRRHG